MTDTRKVADLRIHPRADVVPFPDPETHEQMAADVERRGIVTPLDILADGLVLDGRTRLSIARVLGITEVPVRIVEAADPFDYMVRAALLRRDLSKSQRAMLALELPEYQKAKAEAAERREASKAQPGERADSRIRTQEVEATRPIVARLVVLGVNVHPAVLRQAQDLAAVVERPARRADLGGAA